MCNPKRSQLIPNPKHVTAIVWAMSGFSVRSRSIWSGLVKSLIFFNEILDEDFINFVSTPSFV